FAIAEKVIIAVQRLLLLPPWNADVFWAEKKSWLMFIPSRHEEFAAWLKYPGKFLQTLEPGFPGFKMMQARNGDGAVEKVVRVGQVLHVRYQELGVEIVFLGVLMRQADHHFGNINTVQL